LLSTGASVPRIVLDAGPLIALLHGRDRDHASARRGFEELTRAGTRLIAPLPIVFEVYKWVLYEAGAPEARVALRRMRESLEAAYPTHADLDDVSDVLAAMPSWAGSLEDALVAVVGLRLGAPVWTLNFRDLAAFGSLRFWTPSED
jgi:predicted nucleic acid-binding protein